MRAAIIVLACLLMAGCDKYGSGRLNHLIGNWAEVRLPPGCKAQQIAAESGAGVVVLCEDGRVFH